MHHDVGSETQASPPPVFEQIIDGRLHRTSSLGAMLWVSVDGTAWANYALGHDTIEEYLKQLAHVLCDQCGPTAFVDRQGDAFGVYLPHAANAQDLSHRVRAVVESQFAALRLQARSALDAQQSSCDEGHILTVSVGVGVGGAERATVRALVDDAQAAARQAKLEGRNRVVVVS